MREESWKAFGSSSEASSAVIDLEAVDATGTQQATFGVDYNLPAGSAAASIATRMSLPQDVPWALHNSRGAFLDDDLPIGEQITPGERLTVTPKAHLG